MRIDLIFPARLALAAIACAALVTTPAPAPAQDGGASIEITPFKVEGLVIGNSWISDAAFGEKHNVAVPAPFELIIPRGDDFLNATQPAPGGQGIVKFHFATLDKQPMENMEFVSMTIQMGDIEARLQSVAKALTEEAFPGAVAGSDGSKIDVMRKIEIGPYQAVEVVGRYQNQTDGLVHLRLVGIPHPDRAESVFVVMNLLCSRVAIETLGDFAETRSGRALTTFRYRASADE